MYQTPWSALSPEEKIARRRKEEAELAVLAFFIWLYWPEIKWTLHHSWRLAKWVFKKVTFSEFRQTLRGNNGRFSPLGVQKPKL